jgi:hypothetical protein
MRSIDEVTELAGGAGEALNELGCFLQSGSFEAYAALVEGSAEDSLRRAIERIGRLFALPFTSGIDAEAARAKLAEMNVAVENSDWLQLKTRTKELLQILGLPMEQVEV